MCGILGFINNDKAFSKGHSVFQQMLLDGLKRGVDGTGVMLLDKKNNFHVQKSAMWSPDFVCTQAYQKDIAPFLSDAKFAIGHNRASTKGSICRDNAHPFNVDHITLVHNGFISNSWSLLPQGVNHDVDSFSAAYAIAKKGEKEGLESLRGAFALVWYNEEDNTVNMARNDARPLWLMYLAEKEGKPIDTLLFMSEWENLFSIMSRNDLNFGSKFRLVPVQQHIKFNLGNLREFKRAHFSEPPPYTTTYGGYNNGYRQGAHGGVWTPGQNNSRQAADKEEPQGTANNAKDTSGKKGDVEPLKEELDRIESLFTGLSKRQRKAGGIPTSRKAIRHAYGRLKEKGHRLGQSVLLYVHRWLPYPGARNNFGCILGSKKSDVTCDVEIHNVSQEEYRRIQQTKAIYGTLVNYKETKAHRPVLICVIDFTSATEADQKAADQDPYCCSSIEECCSSGECLMERQNREAKARTTNSSAALLNGPGGSRIELAKFLSLTQEGCCNCNRTIDANKHAEVVWVSTDPLCPDCASDTQIAVTFGLMHPSVLAKPLH